MLKDYFIGQGTGIIESFDTLSEMLEFHKTMDTLTQHFCKLYDRKKHRIADGYTAMGRGIPMWRDW